MRGSESLSSVLWTAKLPNPHRLVSAERSETAYSDISDFNTDTLSENYLKTNRMNRLRVIIALTLR